MTPFDPFAQTAADGRDPTTRLRTFEGTLMAEAIPHIVWMASADGATIYFNEHGLEYMGRPRQINSGWNWLAMVHPDDAKRAREEWESAVRSEEEFALDFRIRRSDGAFLWHAFCARPIASPNGGVQSWIGTATNIDPQKQLELLLRSSERRALDALALLQNMETRPCGCEVRVATSETEPNPKDVTEDPNEYPGGTGRCLFS